MKKDPKVSRSRLVKKLAVEILSLNLERDRLERERGEIVAKIKADHEREIIVWKNAGERAFMVIAQLERELKKFTGLADLGGRAAASTQELSALLDARSTGRF